uniref:Lipase n=1 Tax=Strigamia maritima TaxID=126957 RepID=T1J448_STRMM
MMRSIVLLFPALCCTCRADLASSFEDILLDAINPVEDDEVSREIAKELKMGAPEMIAHYGYKVENHTAKTEDGFLLGLQRIPESTKGAKASEKYPVLLQHGVLCCSGNFIDNGNDSLGFFLADKGYDVWLGNLRANRYSKKHMTLKEEDDAFWDFSIDEHVTYDLPAMIDYIRSTTKKDKILLVAHSMGTTISFSMLASQPEMNKKIKGFLALAPVGSVKYITSSAIYAAKYSAVIKSAAEFANVKQFATHSPFVENFLRHFCPGSPGVCTGFVNLYSGYDSHLINQTRYPIYLSDCTGGTSVKVMNHLGQLITNGGLNKFDYGLTKNKEVYGQDFPPEYDVGKVTAPVILVHAANDALSDPLDVAILNAKLKTVIEKYLFPDYTGTHSAFFWLTNATERFFNKLLELLKKIEKNEIKKIIYILIKFLGKCNNYNGYI